MNLIRWYKIYDDKKITQRQEAYTEVIILLYKFNSKYMQKVDTKDYTIKNEQWVTSIDK